MELLLYITYFLFSYYLISLIVIINLNLIQHISKMVSYKAQASSHHSFFNSHKSEVAQA